MRIQTKFFGEVEIDESQIVTFQHGIPGFDELKKYILLDTEELPKIKCLQSIEEVSVCLMLISPWDYFSDYSVELSDEDSYELNVSEEYSIAVYNVVNIRQRKITANLIAPIVLNVINNNAKQIILSDNKYSLRQEIICL